MMLLFEVQMYVSQDNLGKTLTSIPFPCVWTSTCSFPYLCLEGTSPPYRGKRDMSQKFSLPNRTVCQKPHTPFQNGRKSPGFWFLIWYQLPSIFHNELSLDKGPLWLDPPPLVLDHGDLDVQRRVVGAQQPRLDPLHLLLQQLPLWFPLRPADGEILGDLREGNLTQPDIRMVGGHKNKDNEMSMEETRGDLVARGRGLRKLPSLWGRAWCLGHSPAANSQPGV